MDLQSLFESALKLNPEEKIKLIESLTESLNKSDKSMDQIWSKESEDRYSALINGKVKTYSINEIIQKYK